MSRRALSVALALSVAINLFFLGVVAARAWHRPDRGGHAMGPRDGQWLGWLSDEAKRELSPQRKALRESRREVDKALRAEPFDADRLRLGLSTFAAKGAAVRTLINEALVRRAATLTAAERERLAERHFRGRGRRAQRSKRAR